MIYHRSVPEFSLQSAIRLARSDTKFFILSTLDWTHLTGNRFLDTFFNSPLSPVRRAPLSGAEHIHKSIGYHAFNLYALALLYESFPEHAFWSTKTFNNIRTFVDSDEYVDGLRGNEFGYAYNPPGFEVPFALKTFRDEVSQKEQQIWLERQLRRTYDPETKQFERNNPDSATLTARIYEATRLPNIHLSDDIIYPSS
jgi:hypothetical protein